MIYFRLAGRSNLFIFYLIGLFVKATVYDYIFFWIMLVVGFLNILDIPVKKPRGAAYVFFSILAIAMIIIFVLTI